MKLYGYHIVLLLKRLLLAIGLFFVARLFFFIYNFGLFASSSGWQTAKAFVVGTRFDLSSIMYFNLVFIIIHILPISKTIASRPVQTFLKLYFIIVNGVLLFVNLGDSIFFHFVQKRSTADIFKFLFLSNDVPTLLPDFAKDYWFVIVLCIIFMALSWMVYPKINSKKVDIFTKITKGKQKVFQYLYRFGVMILLLGFTLIAARGGLQLKPLAIIDASKQVKASQMPLVLNTVFTIMTTFGFDELAPKTYTSNEQAQNIYPTLHKFDNELADFNDKNIVVLLVESFSKEYVGSLNNYKGYTPFLDSLMQHSLVLTNAFANGLRSIDAIPAIVTGIPSLMNDPFITSIYSTNKTNSLPTLLKTKGYYSAFFHGGTNGTMNFDGFAGYASFDDYFGRFEYDNDNDYDGYWGIYDEPFLQYFAQKLNSFKQPFFAFEFTLSSHYPYSLPDKYKNTFTEGSLRIHKVVKYTDFALRQFFNTAKNMPWYNNTLFVIIADHPAQSVIPSKKDKIKDSSELLDDYLMSYYKNTSGRYAIPAILFCPTDSLLKGSYNFTAQQTDIFPTILNYINYNEPFISFGNSIFSDTTHRIATQYVNGLYQVTTGEYSLLFDGETSVSLFNNYNDPVHNNNLIVAEPKIADSLTKIAKATVQQYHTRMINNDLQAPK